MKTAKQRRFRFELTTFELDGTVTRQMMTRKRVENPLAYPKWFIELDRPYKRLRRPLKLNDPRRDRRRARRDVGPF